MCSTLPETLILFQTKICDFLHPVSGLINYLIPYFRPEALVPGACPEPVTSRYGTYTVVDVNINWKEMVLSPNDEVANSSKKYTQFKTRVHKHYPIADYESCCLRKRLITSFALKSYLLYLQCGIRFCLSPLLKISWRLKRWPGHLTRFPGALYLKKSAEWVSHVSTVSRNKGWKSYTTLWHHNQRTFQITLIFGSPFLANCI